MVKRPAKAYTSRTDDDPAITKGRTVQTFEFLLARLAVSVLGFQPPPESIQRSLSLSFASGWVPTVQPTLVIFIYKLLICCRVIIYAATVYKQILIRKRSRYGTTCMRPEAQIYLDPINLCETRRPLVSRDCLPAVQQILRVNSPRAHLRASRCQSSYQ